MRISQRQLRTLARRFWVTLFALVIAMAVVVQLARESFPLLNDYRFKIAELLSERLNVQVEIGQVEAIWSGFRPSMALRDFVITSPAGEKVLSVAKLDAELSLIDSLLDRKLAWRRIEFDGLNSVLVMSEKGRWSIRGLPTRKRKKNTFSFNDPLDIFIIGRQIKLANVTLDMHFPTGHHTEVNVPEVVLENDGNFHRMTVDAGVDGETESLQMIVEGHGDPRIPESFDANGYLSLTKFPMERVLAALPGNLWNAEEGGWREGHRMDLKLWYSGNLVEGLSLSGKLTADGLPLNVPEFVHLPSSFGTEIGGSWSMESGWDVLLNNLQITWPEFSAPSLDLRVSGKHGRKVNVDQLNVEPWHQVLVKMGLDKSHFGRTLVNLKPKGTLKSIELNVTNKEGGYFDLAMQLVDGSIEPFLGIPRLKKVNAVVEMTANGGTGYVMSHDGFLLDLPKVYEHALSFESAEGRINWSMDWEKRWAYIGSGLLTLRNEDEVGKGYLHLTLPFDSKYGESKMTLSVGVKKTPLRNYSKYVPNTIPKDLYDWLKQSIGDKGTIKNALFLYNGSLENDPEESPTIQLMARVEGGDMVFDPEWPALSDVYGSLHVDNDNLDVFVERATQLNNQLSNVEISLIDNPEDKGDALSIRGDIRGSATAAVDFLKNSPVREVIGSTFDNWAFDGDVSAEIKLLVPLSTDVKGMSQLVNADVNNVDIDMRDIELQIENVKGHLKYDSDKGLSSEALLGKVWGKPFKATIDSPVIGKDDLGESLRDTQIHFSGRADVADVRTWIQRPELAFMSGGANAEGTLTIPAENTQPYSVAIAMRSQLEGVALDLPAPMTKGADVKKDFSLDLKLYEEYETYEFNYDKFVKLQLVSGDKSREAAQLSLGGVEMDLQPGYFDIVGRVSKLDLLEWDLVLDRYVQYVEEFSGEEVEEDDFPMRLSMDIGEITIGDAGIDEVYVKGFGTEEKWDLTLSSEVIAGDVVLYADDDLPIHMNLDYLNLPAEEIETDEYGAVVESESYLAGIDLKDAAPLDFIVDKLTLAGEAMGSWQFKLRPIDDGIVLHNLQGHVRGVELGKDNAGGEFVWLQKDGVNSSYFSGNLEAKGGGSVLEAWEFEKILDANHTTISAEMSWPGAPDQIQLETIKGQMLFAMEDGNFIRGAQQGENPLLRLIALFNFDTLARRLRLDFSDLAKEGFVFDKVSADFEFEEGRIFLNNPVLVESSSSKMQLAGIVDVINEEIDAQLVVTLPVAGDLTLATALVAGLPAAIGVYIVSKVFREQVDKVSSINYQITGEWDDPKIKFKKIFDDSAAKEKAEEVKNLKEADIKQESEAADGGGEDGR